MIVLSILYAVVGLIGGIMALAAFVAIVRVPGQLRRIAELLIAVDTAAAARQDQLIAELRALLSDAD